MQDLTPLRLFLFSLLLMVCAPVISQTNALANADTALFLYRKSFDKELNYINGREYKPYHPPLQDNPYLNKTSGMGTIYIDGKSYTNKQLTYDIYKDLLIVIPDQIQFSDTYIQINKSLIDSFTISFDKETFHLINYKVNYRPLGLEPGFYERIHKSNESILLVKHIMASGVDDALTTYRHDTKWFLLYDNRFHDVSRRSELLKLFPDSKKQLKRKMKSISLSYKRMNKHQLVQLANYIDTL
ncbi:hypothetical protein [Carboxylicivirga taeanensis]|uniref:hypothetical protein n=1 Tax=Carboxylicivirga taeanensis TaxID=1416875 RepID=UPI003F6E11AB